MKKLGVFLLVLILFSIFSTILIKAQEPPLPPGFERLQNISEKLTDEEARTEYLKQKWQEIFLKNSVISSMDSFFTDISLVFRILFGQPYSFSLTLFLIVILWAIVALKAAEIIRSSINLSEGLSYLAGIAAAVVLAQIQVLRIFVAFLMRFAFSQEAAWARTIAIVFIVAIFIFIYYFGGVLSAYLKQRRKNLKEEETETKQKQIKKFTKGLEKGAGI